MFLWYEKESGQKISIEVVQKLFEVTQGQPGLVSWFGELLTQIFPLSLEKPITFEHFSFVYNAALSILPNNNITNLISKAQQEPYKSIVLSMFKTNGKIPFEFEDPSFNFLYMNGILTFEWNQNQFFAKFPNQFVQEKLFRRFSKDSFFHMENLLIDPFLNIDNIIKNNKLNIIMILEIYKNYFHKNKDLILKNAPRRSDLRIFEATYHFHIFACLCSFFVNKGVTVHPEFPKGNGKIDLLIYDKDEKYGLELKKFTDSYDFKKAIDQALDYAFSLKLPVIYLVVFVEAKIPKDFLEQYQSPLKDEKRNIEVQVFFIEVF